MLLTFNDFTRILIITIAGLLTSCAISPSYVSVMGADEKSPDKVAYVTDYGIPKQYLLWLYAVDGQKVMNTGAIGNIHYAMHPGSHTLWVLAPAAMGGPWAGGRVSPNRCFVFNVDLVAGKTYNLESFNKGKGARLIWGDSEGMSYLGELVDESEWTCYWDK